MNRVGVVHNARNPAVTFELRETEDAIRALGLQLRIVEASNAEEFESAFARLSTERVNGVVLLSDPSLLRGG
jgi:hypothetical protein